MNGSDVMRRVQDVLSRQPDLLAPLRSLTDPEEIAQHLARIATAYGIATTPEEMRHRIDHALAKDMRNRAPIRGDLHRPAEATPRPDSL